MENLDNRHSLPEIFEDFLNSLQKLDSEGIKDEMMRYTDRFMLFNANRLEELTPNSVVNLYQITDRTRQKFIESLVGSLSDSQKQIVSQAFTKLRNAIQTLVHQEKRKGIEGKSPHYRSLKERLEAMEYTGNHDTSTA